MRHRRRRVALAVIMSGSLLAAACGGDDDDASPATSDEGATTTAGAAATTAVADTTETTASAATTEETAAAPETTEGADTTAAGGGGGGAQEACPETEGALVGYSEPIPDPNFALIEAVIASRLEEVGATLAPVNAQLDPGKQIADIQALQQQGIDVLLVNPVAPEAVQGALGEVAAADIPVVVQDTKFGGPYFTNVTADVEAAAQAGAERLKEIVGDGQVAAIIGPPFAEVLVREAEAFAAAAEEIGLNVVDTQTNQEITPEGARALTEAWKQQYGADLAGIWTFNDTSATGVASAFDDTFAPALVSINGQPEAIPLVEAGVIAATYDLQQDMLGRALAYAAIAAICGEEVPEDIWVQSQLIDADNVADWVSPADRGQEDIEVGLEEIDGRTFLVEL